MKLKISIMIIFLILSINNVSSETGKFESYGGSSDDFTAPYQFSRTNDITQIKVQDVGLGQIYKIITVINGNWAGNISVTSQWDLDTCFYIDGNYIGNGILGWNKGIDGKYHIIAFLQDCDFLGYSGDKYITWTNYKYDSCDMKASSYKYYSSLLTNQAAFVYWDNSYSRWVVPAYSYNYIEREYHFINEYEYTKTDYTYFYQMNRNDTHKSKIKIIDSGNNELINETDLKTIPYEYLSYDLDNYTWTITNENFYGDIEVDIIDFSLLISEDEDAPTLTTDKTTYNTSETINISYTNIDKIYDECTSSFCNEAYQIWIYAITPFEDIPKYRNWLYYDRRDETFTLNTSFLSPQNTYKLIITSGEKNIMIESNIFYVYPDEEYLSLSCEKESNCYTYVNTPNTFYYKITNNSNIIIKDNNNNIIHIYYNIIGKGEIIYTIPPDINKDNTYPNWNVYLNNTDYATSYNKEMVVYWSNLVTPTPTSTISPTSTPDINISDQLDNLSIETQPIKELLFGLVYIVIDNPDYNSDNIVSEHEINNWFNSIIPLSLLLLLVILYIGLRKKRE